MESHQWVLAEVEVLDAQVGHLLGPCPGVVEEQQQSAVSEREASFGGQPTEKLFDLVALEEAGLRRSRPLHWNGSDSLADAEQFR